MQAGNAQTSASRRMTSCSNLQPETASSTSVRFGKQIHAASRNLIARTVCSTIYARTLTSSHSSAAKRAVVNGSAPNRIYCSMRRTRRKLNATNVVRKSCQRISRVTRRPHYAVLDGVGLQTHETPSSVRIEWRFRSA